MRIFIRGPNKKKKFPQNNADQASTDKRCPFCGNSESLYHIKRFFK